MFVPANRKDLGARLKPWEIPVDRRSPLGNPFKTRKDSFSERERVIRLYRQWLWKQMQDPQSPAMKELNRILAIGRKYGKVKLVCWCFPKLCHSQIIARALVWMRGWEKGL
ncbi:MAG: DUF4326 domain-containing protein [Syntrophobacteraceae bacterium]